MITLKLAAVAIAVPGLALALAPTAASAAPSATIPVIAGPGSLEAGFATPVVATPAGIGLTFVNGDIAGHDVTSDKTDGSGMPLFRSANIGAGTTPVVGSDRLAPGTYGFSCSIHSWMTGTLVVTPAA